MDRISGFIERLRPNHFDLRDSLLQTHKLQRREFARDAGPLADRMVFGDGNGKRGPCAVDLREGVLAGRRTDARWHNEKTCPILRGESKRNACFDQLRAAESGQGSRKQLAPIEQVKFLEHQLVDGSFVATRDHIREEPVDLIGLAASAQDDEGENA
jgi:hypothetical protein